MCNYLRRWLLLFSFTGLPDNDNNDNNDDTSTYHYHYHQNHYHFTTHHQKAEKYKDILI